jgi:predicted acyl esterase
MEHPEPLAPGEPVALSFSLTPAPARLRAGEILQLDVASRTDLLRNAVLQFDIPAPPYFSRNRCTTDRTATSS